jgi:phage-related protein
MNDPPSLKPVIWIGSSRRDFQALPPPVKSHMGYALYVAQQGGKHRAAKPLKGFGGAGVVEIVTDFDGDTFRAVYTVRLAGAVYVLHALQKKSKAGRATPKMELKLIEQRLREAERIARGEHG